MQDTIFALATGGLGCAVAIIRVSGPAVVDIARRYCGGGLEPRIAAHRRIVDPHDGELIDTGLILLFQAPSSFTGEDCLEFQVHGSRAVVARLLDALGREPGVRMAEPGEFIRRAFDNGKLALTSVEGVADLIDARTDAQRRQALAQAGGQLAARATEWRALLLDALTLVEAEIDFADEGEAPSDVVDEVRRLSADLQSDMNRALLDAQRGERIRSGFRVVIAGPPNAGKSSLLNALVRREVAIVTEHAGTTRDVIEVELDLGGFPVVLCDTAGLRETEDAVESIGIDRTKGALSSADLVLWLFAATGPGPGPEITQESQQLIWVATKADQVSSAPEWADLAISARTGAGLDALVSRVQEYGVTALAGEPPLVTNSRQKACIAAASRHLSTIMAMDVGALELVAEELRRCADELQGLVGRIGTEDVLGSIFSRFCMGK